MRTLRYCKTQGRRDDGRQWCAQRGCGLDIPRRTSAMRGDWSRITFIEWMDLPRAEGSVDGSPGCLASQGAQRLPWPTSPSPVAFYDICWATHVHERADVRSTGCLGESAQPSSGCTQCPARPLSCALWPYPEAAADAGKTHGRHSSPTRATSALGEAKQLYGDRICLMGNFNCLVLARGTVECAAGSAALPAQGSRRLRDMADEVPAGSAN